MWDSIGVLEEIVLVIGEEITSEWSQVGGDWVWFLVWVNSRNAWSTTHHPPTPRVGEVITITTPVEKQPPKILLNSTVEIRIPHQIHISI